MTDSAPYSLWPNDKDHYNDYRTTNLYNYNHYRTTNLDLVKLNRANAVNAPMKRSDWILPLGVPDVHHRTRGSEFSFFAMMRDRVESSLWCVVISLLLWYCGSYVLGYILRATKTDKMLYYFEALKGGFT